MLKTFDGKAWTWGHARHLLNRAGFGGSVAEVTALYEKGFERAVASLTDVSGDGWEMPKPEWAIYEEPRARFREMRGSDPATRRDAMREFQKRQRQNQVNLAWHWLHWMRQSPQPLREKVALFLHGHFATSMDKVKNMFLMWQQNELFRREGLGSFVALTKAVSRDPAMLIYLDGQQNSKRKPNENFAREVMELFTLGEGNYTEVDIAETARAFTGYRVDIETGGFRFVRAGHDDSQKTVFGKTAPMGGDDVIDLIFQKPEAGRFLAKKFWEYFAYESPDDMLVEMLGENFRRSGYDTLALLRAMFRSEEFYSERAMGRLVKSPVQWLVQAGHELECGLPGAMVCHKILNNFGQSLFLPPNVKGWDGGRAWINASTLLQRYNVAAAYCGEGGRVARLTMPEVDFVALVGNAIHGDASAVVDALGRRFYGSEPDGRERESLVTFWISVRNREQPRDAIRGLVRLMMSTPRYQLC